MSDRPNIRASDAGHVYTVGHSTRSIEDFVALLEEFEIKTLADIRRYPGSRRHPHFSSATLADTLRVSGIAYRHLEALGGRRKAGAASLNSMWRNESFRAYADYMATPEFHAAIDLLLSLEGPFAIMCAEAVPWRCHRNLVSDELSRRRVEVLHILDAGTSRRHERNPAAVERAGHLEYPAPGEMPPLF